MESSITHRLQSKIPLSTAIELADYTRLLSQQLIIEAFYLNEDDKRQKPIKKIYPIRELRQGLREIKTSK